ncbi:MAG: hypothetical protein KF712_09820 [Akkermansiaceae bacterium]|nr:hypothetical protein [Akkermansiaceae bacterium]
MFCSWKTSPAAPCSCAYRLHSPVDELLNHLCSLGKGTLILRRPGLSLAKATRFGLHIRSSSHDWSILHDAISGLETDLAPPQHAYLLREFPDQCPLFAMGPPGKPIEFTVRLDGHDWNSPAVRDMLARFGGVALDCLESHRLGAGAWLDEWEQCKQPSPCCPDSMVHETSGALQACRLLEVEIRTTTQRSEVCFSPSFVDVEGSVLRIADRSRSHIVYADVNAAEFRLAPAGAHCLRLCHTT